MVAALTRVFGVHNLALAEDVVQDAFCRALEVWKFRGVPDNPSAWLMTTAKHRAIDVLRRERTARTFAPELGRLLESEWTLVPMVEELFGRVGRRGRPAADDVLVLPSAPARGGAGRARAPHPVRLRRQRDRRRVSEHRRGDAEAHLARQEGAGRIEAAVRPRGRGLRRAAVGRPPRALSALQRGLPRRIRRIGGARRAVPRGACASRCCSSSIRSPRRPRRTRWRR